MRDMTNDELLVIRHLAMAWNTFLTLPVEHADDVPEFRQGIHALQAKIMCRPVRADLKSRGMP